MEDKKKKDSLWLPLFMVILLFLAGAGVFLYPDLSNWYMERHQGDVIQTYEKTVETVSAEVLEAEKEAVRQYNRSILENQVILTDPFDEDAVRRDAAQYEQRLALDEVMAHIEIPEIQVYLPIYHGTEKETLEKGIGHLENTSLPMGGTGTHCVLSGHTGLPSAELFTNLEKLEEGDLFFIHVLDETLAYETDRIEVVKPDDVSSLGIDAGQDYVTLITCTPYGKNTHRLLVRGHRIPYSAEQKEEIKEKEKADVGTTGWLAHRELPGWAWGVLAVSFIVCILLLISGKKCRK